MLLNRAIMLNYAHIYLATIMLKLCQHNLPRPICSTVAEAEKYMHWWFAGYLTNHCYISISFQFDLRVGYIGAVYLAGAVSYMLSCLVVGVLTDKLVRCCLLPFSSLRITWLNTIKTLPFSLIYMPYFRQWHWASASNSLRSSAIESSRQMMSRTFILSSDLGLGLKALGDNSQTPNRKLPGTGLTWIQWGSSSWSKQSYL